MKYFKYLLYLPIPGILIPYVYALICIIESKTNCFLYGDPAHFYSIGKYYNSFQIILFLCIFCVIVNFFILLFSLLLTKEYQKNLIHLYVYFGIILFMIILYYIDPGYYISWFFD